MSSTLATLRAAGILTALDERFARALARIAGDTSDEALLALAVTAHRVGEAHVCVDLRELAGRPLDPRESERIVEEALVLPEAERWIDALERSPLVRGANAPLVLEGSRLYLRRYWTYEQDLGARVLARAAAPAMKVDRKRLRAGLRRLFTNDSAGVNWQRVAAAIAVVRRFAVVSGGPGTGKTWTVARILALLAEQALGSGGPPPRIHLLAPTGKAAARLRESIRESRGGLDCEEAVRAAIPDDASTIHRALGAGHGGRFAHGPDRPLVTDAVVVDEASMVDLALMSRLLAALPGEARVILLGDRDQLASVEAGSVLADLCGGEDAERTSRFSRETAAEIFDLTGDRVPEALRAAPTALSDSIVYLQGSRRFRDRPAIGALAEAIQRGDADLAIAVLQSATGGVELLPPATPVAEIARRRYEVSLREVDPARKLEAFGAFRVLCAHREGSAGVGALNAAIAQALAARGLLRTSDPYYVGRAIMVTRNDASTRLFNGDTGLVADLGGEAPKAIFPAIDGEAAGADSVRAISLSRLPSVETAFAITIHKSQGSEFGEVLIVLPDAPTPVLTRELLYTAVTRARESVRIRATPEIVAATIRVRSRRGSGLAERLRSPKIGL